MEPKLNRHLHHPALIRVEGPLHLLEAREHFWVRGTLCKGEVIIDMPFELPDRRCQRVRKVACAS